MMAIGPNDPQAQSDKSNLLRQLRIAPSERDGPTSQAARSKIIYVVSGLAAVALLAGALAFWKWHSQRYTVEVATALAPSTAHSTAVPIRMSPSCPRRYTLDDSGEASVADRAARRSPLAVAACRSHCRSSCRSAAAGNGPA